MSKSERTAAEAKADYVAKMGEEIGAIYAQLWQEVAWINKKWRQYVELFGTDSERIELLNRAAPSMFRTVQDTLWEDLLLHLARLIDPPKSIGKSNLSVPYLASTLIGSPIEAQAQVASRNALTACGFARDWRNRRLAHRDLNLALGQSIEPLAPASRLAVKEALAELENFLNVVSKHYLDSTTCFSLGPGGHDAISLLALLRDGLDAREERRALTTRRNYRQNIRKSDSL